MKINLLIINGKTIIKEKYFYDLEEKILEKDFLDINTEIELISFGKKSFQEKAKENSKIENKKRYFDESGNIFFLISGEIDKFNECQVEDGFIKVYNEENNKLWSGQIVDGIKTNGKGLFEWKDKENKVWKCEGQKKKTFNFCN
jgi:hypothetical protein